MSAEGLLPDEWPDDDELDFDLCPDCYREDCICDGPDYDPDEEEEGD